MGNELQKLHSKRIFMSEYGNSMVLSQKTHMTHVSTREEKYLEPDV